jgi:hypothetical protein
LDLIDILKKAANLKNFSIPDTQNYFNTDLGMAINELSEKNMIDLR